MNLIDNGVKEFISVERVDDGEYLGFKVVYKDWYNKECSKIVNSIHQVQAYKDRKVSWTE